MRATCLILMQRCDCCVIPRTWPHPCTRVSIYTVFIHRDTISILCPERVGSKPLSFPPPRHPFSRFILLVMERVRELAAPRSIIRSKIYPYSRRISHGLMRDIYLRCRSIFKSSSTKTVSGRLSRTCFARRECWSNANLPPLLNLSRVTNEQLENRCSLRLYQCNFERFLATCF